MATLDPNALITLQDAKDHLGITNTNFDDLLIRFINSATAKIEGFLDRKIKQRTYTEIQDGKRDSRIILRQWPIVSVSELRFDSDQNWSDPNSLVPSTDYFINDQIEIVLKNRLTPRGRGNVRIIYDAGYSTVPYDLQEACIWTVEFFYDMRSDRRVGVSSKSKNAERIDYNQELPEFVFSMLEKYKRVEFFSELITENG